MQLNLSEMVIVPLIKLQYKLFSRWFRDKFIKSACRNCVSYNDGCCVYPFFWEWKIILLPSEIKRISEYTGKPPSFFVDDSPLVESQLEYYTAQNNEDPEWSRLFLLWNNPAGLKGRCPFLTTAGCSLPYTIKPMLCQIYPLNFNVTEKTVFVSEEPDCLLLQLISGREEVLAHFNDGNDSMQLRFTEFCQELKSLINSIEKGKALRP